MYSRGQLLHKIAGEILSVLHPGGEDIVGAYLPYFRDVVLQRKSQGPHCNTMPPITSASDICKSTGSKYLMSNFNLFSNYHGLR